MGTGLFVAILTYATPAFYRLPLVGFDFHSAFYPLAARYDAAAPG